jgi:hypothetical protein
MMPDPLYVLLVFALGLIVALYVRPITLMNSAKAIGLGLVVCVVGIVTTIFGGDDPMKVLLLRAPLGFGRLYVAGLGLILGGLALVGILLIRGNKNANRDSEA